MTTLIDPSAFDGKVYSNGWTVPSGGVTAIVEPATGHELGRTGVADASDVDKAAASAATAQKEWAAATFQERAAVLRKAGLLIEQNLDELVSWVVREAGTARPTATFFVGELVLQECYEAAALASQPPGLLLPTNQPRLSMIKRVPAGVVGVISPFNVPMVLSIRSVAPALALGNAVVLKPDLRTPVAGGYAIARIFEEAGLPDGLLHVLPGGAETGAALVADPRVRVISFTGSTAAGRKVGELAGKHLKRAHLELGGNSALIVLDDADIERAVSAGAWGSYLHQGQVCMTAGRHLVHESVAESYVEALAEHAGHLPVGDPNTGEVALGPLIDEGQLAKVDGLVKSTVDAGARLLAGGTHEGLFYRPTVLDGVGTDMPAYANEVFGPVAPVVRFSSDEEAAALASASEYGLSLSILTGDAMRGLALAERIPTGIAHVNDQTIQDEAAAPFGGVAASGTGARFGGLSNLEAFTEQRWITVRGEIPAYPF
jgi:benzaldehyde dehydrogenase (NAD)